MESVSWKLKSGSWSIGALGMTAGELTEGGKMSENERSGDCCSPDSESAYLAKSTLLSECAFLIAGGWHLYDVDLSEITSHACEVFMRYFLFKTTTLRLVPFCLDWATGWFVNIRSFLNRVEFYQRIMLPTEQVSKVKPRYVSMQSPPWRNSFIN